MRKSIAKSLVVGLLLLAFGLISFSPVVASAKTTKTKTVRTVKVKTVKAHKRTLPGKVISVSGTTLVMKKGNTNYTIEAAGITPVNRKGTAIALADIKVGHKISVKGTVTGTVVSNILKLRDITLPIGNTK